MNSISAPRAEFSWRFGIVSATALLAFSIAPAQAPKAQPVGPLVEIVQTLKGGEDGLPKPFIIAYTIAIKGNFVYVGGNNIACFKSDPESGKLTYLGEVADVMSRVTDAFPKRKANTGRKTCIIKLVGGRLYAIPQGGSAMAWYDIDDKTGKLTEKGLVECQPCFHAVVSPDQKDIYLLTNPYARGQIKKMSVSAYHLDADGKPVLAGEVFGEGFAGCDQSPYEGVLQMSPDGKFIYAISGREHAMACIERKPNGEIAYKSTTDLKQVASGEHKYPWSSMFISPDGKYLYAQLWAYGKPVDNHYGIFKRDLESGALTFQESIAGDKDPLTNLRGWQHPLFLKDGRAFIGRYDLGLWNFKYDAETGHLLNPVEVKDSQRYKANVAYDTERGLIYIGGVWILEGGIQDGFRVLKMEMKK